MKMVLTLFYVSLEPVINVSGRFFSEITSSQKIQTHKQNNQSLSYSNDYGVSCYLSLYFGSHTSCTAEKQPLFAATTHNKRQVVTSHSRRSFCLSLHHKNALKELSIFWHELAPPKDLKIDPDTGSRREMPFVPQGEKYFANEYSFILGCYLKLDL